MGDVLDRLEAAGAAVLVVDVQEKLMAAIEGADARLAAVRKLVSAAGVLGVPVVVTEQYPKGLGGTCAEVRDCLGGDAPPAFEKLRFTACVEGVVARLAELGRRQVIVAGVETHVCVQQSALDLLRLGHAPYVCADAVGSRRGLDHEVALGRMRQAGAVVTTVEGAVFEMLGAAGTDQFKRVLGVLK